MPGKSHGWRNLVGYSPRGRKESDTTEQLHFTNYGGDNEDNGDLPEKIPGIYCHSPCPQPCSRPTLTHTFTGDSWTPTGKSTGVGGPLPFSWVLGHKVLMCPPRVYFPVLCKFWQLYSGVNGDLLQEDLCHSHTQSPCPCGRLLPTCTFTGHAQTQFCLNLYGIPGSWCTQGLFEPPECVWQEQSLILNANSPFLPSCWGFSFAFRHGVSPHRAPVSTVLLGFFLCVCMVLEQQAAKRR